MIYTSGSTGKPKGVCIEHRNIVNYVLGVIERLRLEPGMSYATVSTIAADLGNTVIFPALATGGCLHVISQERAENGSLLAEYFEREKIDVLKIVPSHFAALNPAARHAGEAADPRRRGLAPRLDREAARPGARLRDLQPLRSDRNHGRRADLSRRGRAAGHAIGHAAARASPAQQSKSGFVEGEICIGGAGVARGYLNRPELTAEKFAGGVYRTGDRGRALPDGSIEFCGRVDHQVKVHGYRVELGEIEAALRSHEKVRDAVVLLREDQLVAWVAPNEVDQRALREYLKARLPQYMVPSAFGLMERLPLTPNGKIDRQALTALSIQKETPSVAPRTETEKALAAIWSELLQAEVGVDDDVFDLGAHSLMAMKALTQIRERFEVSLSLRNLFEHPTIAGLAEVIDGLWFTKAKSPVSGESEEFVL